MEETLYVDVREDYFIYKKTNIVESSFNLDLVKAAQNRMQHIYWKDKSAFVCVCVLSELKRVVGLTSVIWKSVDSWPKTQQTITPDALSFVPYTYRMSLYQ